MSKTTSKYCSRIIVVHVHATVFSKVQPVCRNIANSIKPGSDSKMTNEHAADCSKAVCNLCERYELFIQQCGQRYPYPR